MARISWGRRPGDDRPIIDLRRRWPVAAVLVFALLVSGLDGFVYRSVIQGETPQQIQSKMDQHLRTLERGDLFQYELTLDRRSDDHTRCKTELFELGPERAAALHPFKLIRVQETGPTTLVRAFVRHRDGVAVEYFRRVRVVNLLSRPPFDIRSSFDVWYFGSPEPPEVGERRTREADGVVLTYWEIDEQVSETVVREVAAARRAAVARGVVRPLQVTLAPAPELSAARCGGDLAAYLEGSDEILLDPLWTDAERTELSAPARAALLEVLRRWAERPGSATTGSPGARSSRRTPPSSLICALRHVSVFDLRTARGLDFSFGCPSRR